MNAIETTNLTKRYKDLTAVDGTVTSKSEVRPTTMEADSSQPLASFTTSV